jgi:hypothetical protein
MSIRVVWTDVIRYSICTDGYYDISSIDILSKLLKPGMTMRNSRASLHLTCSRPPLNLSIENPPSSLTRFQK